MGFDYGQRHAVEMQARQTVRDSMTKALPQYADRLGDDHVVDLIGYGRIAESALTADRKIEMDARGLPTTFVPGRNLIFLVAAAALADRRGLEVLVGGMCETDYSGYPDCRHDTMVAMARALSLGLDKPGCDRDPADVADEGSDVGTGAADRRGRPGRDDHRG